MLRRAKDTIFWIGLVAAEVRQLAQNCRVCQQTQSCNAPELPLLHDGYFPFEKVGVDISEFERDFTW